MKLLNRILIGVIALMACGGALASYYSESDVKQILLDEAARQGVSPSLVLGIARVESNFDPMALSHAGAKGVMQIMPRTAKTEFGVAAHRLYDPRTNVRIGVAFIKQLIETYDGRVDIALSHYNGGSAVRTKYGDLQVIPRTARYVRLVQQYARRYQIAGYDGSYSPSTKPFDSVDDDFNARQRSAIAKLDDFGWINPAKKTSSVPVSGVTIKGAANVNFGGDRVDRLQQLQVHNLTRHVSRETNQRSSLTSAYEVVNINDFETSSKRQKVALWESILN